MCVHLKEVEEVVNKNQEKDWSQIYEKIKSQIILRALSCVQLANKLSSNNTVIHCCELKQILADLGYIYSLSSILNSEMRVFKYLGYKLNIPTPYIFMEILLELLGNNNDDLDPKIFYFIGVKILECFYYSREEIYDSLHETLTGRTREKNNRDCFEVLENDYLYLSSSVIVASSHIFDKKDQTVCKKVKYFVQE